MKTKISILLTIFALAMQAQWNKTFNINGNNDFLAPSFVIGTFDYGSVSVSWGNDAPSTPRNDYFIVTKHDAFGNTVFNRLFFPPNMPDNGFVSVEALLEKDNKDLLVAGYYYDDQQYIMQPFLMGLDVNGNFQFLHWYKVNDNPFIGFQDNKISLARVEDDQDETYFIVSSALSDAYPVTDAVVSVIKVKTDGSMIWSKKYFDSNVPPTIVRDVPGDITFSPSEGFYMITGWRQEITGAGQDDKIFFFGIDRDGNVVTYYKSVTVIPGGTVAHASDEDMIWDPHTKTWVVTFAIKGLDPGTYNFTYSTIGLISIDAALTINLHHMYWHSDAKEHFGLSISQSINGEYVIGAHTYDGVTGLNSPALLKVDNGGNPQWFMKYNIYDMVNFGHHCNSFNPNTGDEEYVLVNEQKTDLRVIRTDINGKSCGARDYQPIVDKYDYKEELYKYYPKEIGDYTQLDPKIKKLDPEERTCTDATYDSYRTAFATGIKGAATQNASSLNVYPTETSINNPVLTFENNSDIAASMDVMDINGKLIFSATNIPNGKNTVQLSGKNSLAEGIYFVKCQSNDGKISETKKIIITK